MQDLQVCDERERMVRWVDEFTRGLGVPAREHDRLLAGVHRTVLHAASEGTTFDCVAVVRRPSAFEVQLSSGSSSRCDTFLLQL